MRRLIWVSVGRTCQKVRFFTVRPIYRQMQLWKSFVNCVVARFGFFFFFVLSCAYYPKKKKKKNTILLCLFFFRFFFFCFCFFFFLFFVFVLFYFCFYLFIFFCFWFLFFRFSFLFIFFFFFASHSCLGKQNLIDFPGISVCRITLWPLWQDNNNSNSLQRKKFSVKGKNLHPGKNYFLLECTHFQKGSQKQFNRVGLKRYPFLLSVQSAQSYRPCYAKMCPHPRSLIRAFTIHQQNHWTL